MSRTYASFTSAVGWSVWLSLTNFSVQDPSKAFVGLSNYAAVLPDPEYLRGAANAIGYLAATTLLKLAVGVGTALLLARPFPGRALVFLLAFLPWAYPGGLGLVGWYWFIIPPLHTAYSLAMSNVRFAFDGVFGIGAWRFLSLVIFNVWRGGSFVGIFLLAALNGIPQDLFDYAALEVKNGWHKGRFRVVWIGPANSRQANQVGLFCVEGKKHIWGSALPAPAKRKS